MSNYYATIDDLKPQIQKQRDGDDAVLQFLLDTAAQLIDQMCNRPDGFKALITATARTYPGSGNAIQWINECVEVTKVEYKDSSSSSTWIEWGASDWLAATGDPKRPNFNRTPYHFLVACGDYLFTSGRQQTVPAFRQLEDRQQLYSLPTVRVTARWGYADIVPLAVTQAVVIQTARWYTRGRGAWADTVASTDLGQMMYLKKLDPDIANILEAGRLLAPLFNL